MQAASNQIPLDATVTMNVCSLMKALRDMELLLKRGNTTFVLEALDALADRVEATYREEQRDI